MNVLNLEGSLSAAEWVIARSVGYLAAQATVCCAVLCCAEI